MKKVLLLLFFCGFAVVLASCSNNHHASLSAAGSRLLAAEPLRLAGEAYIRIATFDPDKNNQQKQLVAIDLERAYLKAGQAQTLINHLNSKAVSYPDERDYDFGRLSNEALEGNKPDFKTALALARVIKNPAIRSDALLDIIDALPASKRLPLLLELEKSVAQAKDDEGGFSKGSKYLALASHYLKQGKKTKARNLVLASHPYLVRNPTVINAKDFAKAAKIEAKLGLPSQTLCKLTRFLHKRKHRPIALANIKAAYLSQGYLEKVCLYDDELVSQVRQIPDAGNRVYALLKLAEAWHKQKDTKKTNPLVREAIKSSAGLTMDQQSDLLISLYKIAPPELSRAFSVNYWQKINAIAHPYNQSSELMTLVINAYLAGLSELSLDSLKKMKEPAIKHNTAMTLLRFAKEKNDHDFIQQILQESYSAAILAKPLMEEISLLIATIESAQKAGNATLEAKALKRAEQGVTKIAAPVKLLRLNYALQLAALAKQQKKGAQLAQSLIKRSEQWFKQDFANPYIKPKRGSKAYYQQQTQNAMRVKLIESQVLLGNYPDALLLLNTIRDKNSKATAICYAAQALSQRRMRYGMAKSDNFLMKSLKQTILAL